jgi:hypothetical protein
MDSVNFRNPAFFVLYGIGVWLAVNYVISVLSGWAELGRVYRARGKFQGQKWSFQSGQMRLLMGIHNALTAGADSQGLYLALFFPFRPGNPPLYIPWDDVTAREVRVLFWDRVEFRFRQAPYVYLRVRKNLARELAVTAGESWPGNRLDPVSSS